MVWSVVLDSSLRPVDCALRLARDPGFRWLDGGLLHGHEGRYSFVCSQPVEVVSETIASPQVTACLDRLGLPARGAEAAGEQSLLSAGDVPHWIGHIAYDAHPIVRARFRHARRAVPPLAHFARYDALYAFDHQTERAYVVGDDRAACERVVERLARPPLDELALAFRAGPVTATPEASHRQAVALALDEIRAGNVYQLNLARRFAASFEGSPLGLFLRMRAQSPVPLGYFAQEHDFAILGRSMERFLRLRAKDRCLWTSPIKGTIARRGDDARDVRALSQDEKEQAEHAMVVDLMRNDLSRVCEVGSVEVAELMRAEPFAGLFHLVSTVRGRVRPQLTLGDVAHHTFPPGSISGTPKESALSLIERLEPAARGVYTGSVGFVDREGGLSLAVSIRTAMVSEGEVEYFAGGGIVIDSDPQRETAETELKAQVFLRALDQTKSTAT